MFVSPSKLRKNRILRNRTINFETPKRTHGNIVFIPTLDKEAIVKTFNAGLFRPMQLLASFSPRSVKPFGRKPLLIDQKNVYAELRQETNGRFKKGKVNFNSYNGQNIFYNLYDDYRVNADAYKLSRKNLRYQKTMYDFLFDKIDTIVDDPDYTNAYVIFPMNEYIPNLKRLTLTPGNNVEPFILFLKSIFKESIPGANTNFNKKIKLFIFYNPNAKAMVVVDLYDPKFEKEKEGIFQKILRLNNFNADDENHDDLTDDVEIEADPDESESDKLENKKEEIKNVVFKKIAKKLRADNLTDFEAASEDEQNLILTIDKKLDDYLDNDSNSDKTFADMVANVESDDEVKSKAVRYVETKKAAAQRLDNHAKGLEKETEIIGSIQDLDDDSKDNIADEFKVAEPDIDPRIEKSHLSSMDEEYNKKQAMKDITNVISAFSSSEYLPITVDNIDILDSSDERDLKKTYIIRYKTDDGKPLSFQLDVPDIIDKRFFYLGGNKKFIKKQIVRLPVVKTKSNRVEITTNFNKMTIERTNGKLSRSNAYLLKKMKEFTNNPAVKIIYGYNGAVNSKKIYNNDFEYEELANSITSIETPKYFIHLNRDNITDEIALLDIEDGFFEDENFARTPLGFEKKGDAYIAIFFIENISREVFRYDIETHRVEKVAKTMFDFLAGNVLSLDMNKIPSIGKSFVYTVVKFLATTYPMFAVVGSQVGITNILKRYNIGYKISEKQIKGDLQSVEVKFKNCYLYYEDTVRATLLLNALYLFNTQDYTYEQFDTEIPYTHYFMKVFGDALGMHIRNTLRINLAVVIDPITRDVLKDLKLPTNIIDVLLYANSLLVGNQYKPQNNMTNYRIKGNEIVADIMYKIIADAYIEYQKHKLNGRPVNLKIDKGTLVKELLAQPNVNDKTILNPTMECEQIAQASAKGFMGVNINDAYTLEMRAYDPTMNGFLSGNATPYSGQAGITRSLTYDPKITSVRGYIPNIDENELSATNMLSPTELLASFTSAGADSPRQAMQVAQTGHTMPIMHPSKQLIGTGMNKTIAFLISDDFCFHAKKSGIVRKIDTKYRLALLDYDDGTRDAIDLSDKLDKNSNMGFYIHQNFKICFKEGERFAAGDILAYNPNYFQGKGKDIDYCPGTLAKVAIASGDFSFEDSTLISETLGEKCSAKINMLKQVVLGKNAIVYDLKKVGDKVVTGDSLIDFTSSFDDPDTTEFLSKLSATVDQEYLDEITHEQVKAKYSGEITEVQIVYNCDFEELSPSLQNVIKKYKAEVAARKNALNGIKADSVHIPPIEKVSSRKSIKEEFPAEGGVIINIWIEYIDVMGMGDKLTYNTALKGVVSRVLKKDEAPLTEYRSDEPVEGVLTPTGVISRMTSDIYKLLFSNKVLVEVGKQVREIWRGSGSEKEKFTRIKKLVLDVVKAIDNQKGLNIRRHEEMFDVFEKNPKEFRNWSVLNSDELDSSISVYFLPFEEPKMQQIKKAADILHCPLEEYIYYRMNDPRGIRSKTKVPVGYVHIKRVRVKRGYNESLVKYYH